MSASATSTATRSLVFNETSSRLSPAKCAVLVGIQVLLVVVCMAVIIREVVLAGESSSEATLLAESSGTGLPLYPGEQPRIWAGLSDHQAATKSPEVGRLLSSEKGRADDSVPDCVETGNTKMAKAVWVFLAGALLNSERARSIIVAGAL